jgi:anthranilate synthase component 1
MRINAAPYLRRDMNRSFVVEEVDFTPGLDRLCQLDPERYPFLLQSVHPTGASNRYDILFAFPGRQLSLGQDLITYRDGTPQDDIDFLTCLDQLWSAERDENPVDIDVPFVGGWFVFLGYELAHQIEPRLQGSSFGKAATGLPIAAMVRIPAAVINDYQTLQTLLICDQGFEQYLAEIKNNLEQIRDVIRPQAICRAHTIAEDDSAWFIDSVDRIKRYIRAGDVFQVNISRAWHARVGGDILPVDIYRRLCESNPAPFAGLMHWNAYTAVLSSSPERLVQTTGRRIRTRPIAGTHPRGKKHTDDINQARKLLQNPKERAEHIMLIDLERNDLGRVCEIGSVEVSEFMTIESYRHVHHIVSEVRGRLKADTSPGQVIRAVFPGGTITGCPKVRCMEIIQELEQGIRGAYTGAMGYLNRNGDMDLNILIRTMTWDSDKIELRAGAGIVADSQPQRELAETRSKAEGMLRALG